MKRRAKRGLAVGALVLASGFAGLNALAYSHADAMLNTVRNRFRAMQVPAFPSAELLVFWGGRQWGFDGFTHNPSDYASSVRCPVLLMHGARDTRVKITEARRVFEAVPGTKEFVTFEQSGHESYLSTQAAQWRTAIKGVMERT